MRTKQLPKLLLLGPVTLTVAALAARAAPPPEKIAPVIETVLAWAIEGRDLPSDPPKPSPTIPHRGCGGRFDPEHLPATVYVSWDLSAEAQHAACNWTYDVASHRATPLSQDVAKDVAKRIAEGNIGPQERAFFHSAPQRDGKLRVAAGYCWGSATGTFVFRPEGPVLVDDLTVHGY